jgi:ubiquinone/menaquinone biosynthesis C-methylase UbiE
MVSFWLIALLDVGCGPDKTIRSGHLISAKINNSNPHYMKRFGEKESMELSPRLYNWFIRPKWLTNKYIHRPIQEHFNFMNKTVLDFGCGTGANSCICHAEGYLGVDPDAKRVQLASQMFPHYTFKTFDEKRIPSPNDAFDHILIIAVLHHIPNDLISEYVAEFQRVLKPGGELIVIEPYLCETTAFNNRFMNWYDNGAYIRNEEEYLQFFRTSGFECQVLRKFTKCFVYNEMFFCAKPQDAMERVEGGRD